MTAPESAGARRSRGPELLQTRFGQRLREVLPGGELVLSQRVQHRGRGDAGGPDADRMLWTRAGEVLEFALRVELTPSLEKVRALPEVDLRQQPVRVLLAPRLSSRACLQLEQKGWSYCAVDGPMLIQHHAPLVAIRLAVVRSTAVDVRTARAAAADLRGRGTPPGPDGGDR